MEVITLLFVCFFIIFLSKRRKIKRPSRKEMNIVRTDLREMTGIQFEQCMVQVMYHLGYTRVVQTKASGDYGADVIAEKKTDDGVLRVCIQCKRYANPVNLKAVQEIAAARSHYGCHTAIVATTSTYTQSAINLAKTNNVVLWDIYSILPIITEMRRNLDV